jgi:hypothetical protein
MNTFRSFQKSIYKTKYATERERQTMKRSFFHFCIELYFSKIKDCKPSRHQIIGYIQLSFNLREVDIDDY